MTQFVEGLTNWSFRTRDGITLCGHETPMHGRPIIFFRHGNGLSSLSYRPMLERLYHHFDLVFCDAQGHGDSEVGGQFLGWSANASHAVEIIEANRERWGDVPLLGLGHSFGGALTLLASAQRPGLFSAMVLLDPVFLPQSVTLFFSALQRFGFRSKNPNVHRTLKRRDRWESRESAFESLSERGAFKSWDREAFAAYIHDALGEDPETGEVYLKCPKELEAEVFSVFPSRLWSAVRRNRVPTKVFIGGETYPPFKQGVSSAVKKNRMIESEVLPGGHNFMQEDPAMAADRVIEQFQTFLNQVATR